MVDILVPDDLWEKIRPADSEGESGMLCSFCIMVHVEELCQEGPEYGPNEYGAWELTPLPKSPKKTPKPNGGEEIQIEDGWAYHWILAAIVLLMIVLAILVSQ